ncbi:hypothetical protein [Nocardia sp. NPDC019395]|uniref:hypothetical protein n=1 Tax=Nocardia sp. NPDC019395 TaxID=3154686 RepID=UPI003405AB3F
MTDSQGEGGEEPSRGAAESVPPPVAAPGGPGDFSGGADSMFYGSAMPGPPAAGPGYGLPGPGYQPPLPYPPPARGGNTMLIVAGVLGLVVVLVVGVVIGFVASGGDGSSAAAGESAPEKQGPGTYSMSGVTNACDLVDPTPLTKWSPTPEGAPVHEETPQSPHSNGTLKCEVAYTSKTEDPLARFSLNEATMMVEAELADSEQALSHFCTKPARDHLQMGEISGLGTRGCWISELYGDLVESRTYRVEALDGNVGVGVRINLTREQGSPPVSWGELDAVARAQVRRTFDGLKQN